MPNSRMLLSQRSLLLRYCDNTEALTNRCADQKLNNSDFAPNQSAIRQMKELVFELNGSAQLLSETLSNYITMLDSMDTPFTKKEEEEVDELIERVHTAIDNAHREAIDLEAKRLTAVEAYKESGMIPDIPPQFTDSSQMHMEPTPLRLPPIPIPVFTGKVWEFENFWTLFDANVHSQPLSRLQKFNYLLSALRGDARDSVRRFHVTDANYDNAVRLLRRKYGDESRLIDTLQSRLENTRADNNSLECQRRLLENIMPIVTQLEDKGVNLNGSFHCKRILAKFNQELQWKVLEKCLTTHPQEQSWILSAILSQLDDVITIEERINYIIKKDRSSKTFNSVSSIPSHMSHRTSQPNPFPSKYPSSFPSSYPSPSNTTHPASPKPSTSKRTYPSPSTHQNGSAPCLFCNTNDHISLKCPRCTTIEERRNHFRATGRCLNCGSMDHFINNCTREGCRNCGGKKHHHTLCPAKIHQIQSRGIPQKVPSISTMDTEHNPEKSQIKKADKHTYRKPSQAQAHTLETELQKDFVSPVAVDHDTSSEGTVVSSHHKVDVREEIKKDTEHRSTRVLLLTGTAKVRDSVRNQWKDVDVLLDTGADQSFISNRLANELGLEFKDSKTLQIYTFGVKKPKHTVCSMTKLQLKDSHGSTHEIHLHTLPVVTATGKSAFLTKEDHEFIKEHNIHLSRSDHREAKTPQILLGCDQLWEFLNVSLPQYTLPSGLHAVPSKLGYLITGKQITKDSPIRLKATGKPETEPTTPVVSVNTMIKFKDDFEELERWDRYWTMDSSGICEFTGTVKAEKDATNAEVAKFFEETIQKREDGYYIRFPFKKNHPPLPSNKAIAMKRLRSVLNSLRKTPQILQDYNDTFATQQKKGIIEQIPNTAPETGKLVHYIPHQPVITPNKETTKLRIVFDASAHFKDSPSLNDILHQGPTILPELYTVLLRFRVPRYIAISDVEKAFLQVRLQEMDRDVTRFLWVRDINAPLNNSNIITYRFTRVTFGLNVSPFLLGATIRHHLHNAVSNIELAKEIEENLYVDNLVLGGETSTEIIQKSKDARQIFADMEMNLRQFTSNNTSLYDELPTVACASLSPKKLLGIQWDASNDHLSIRCSLSSTRIVTKRTVASQIASIYDPFGWIVPLLIPAKKFQQDLWRHKLQWDDELPNELRQQWSNIVDNTNGFHRSFPRRFYDGPKELQLAVFADASKIALATCAYLFNSECSTLVMARSKLPSIKAKTTIPKLEMSAITMAMRLANSIIEALKSRKSAVPRGVVILSDSTIALSWLSSTKSITAGVLVRNKVSEVRRITQRLEEQGITTTFAHVPTSLNPADAGTRGLSKEEMNNEYWWNGPQFLRTPIDSWPIERHSLSFDTGRYDEDFEQFDKDNVQIHVLQAQDARISELIELKRYDSFLTGCRITALVLRFLKSTVQNSPQLRERITTTIPEMEDISINRAPVNGPEIQAARKVLIRNHQSVYLTEDYKKKLKNTLRLYLDTRRIWRSLGRIGHAEIQEDAKHPIFVAPKTVLAEHLIKEAHGTYHRGIEHTIATVRQHYWIPKIRQQVRQLTTRCIPCRKFNALPYQYPDSPDLPSRRTQRCYPFQHTGLDFFDLPPCKENGDTHKLHGCIFTCTATRLIHLEIVKSMATEDFLNALRRFIARRGLPESITCDNAPTFLLCANIMRDSSHNTNEDVQRATANRGIQWHHITPYAPWQGGFYESLIKSIKHALYKALGGTKQRSLDEITTIVTEIEACLNTRPLTYQGSSHEEFSLLRPIDLLQKDMILNFPEIQTPDEEDNLYLPPDAARTIQTRQQAIKALQSSIHLVDRFWKTWQQQYLTSLRETHKRLPSNRRLGQETPTVGDIVLVNDPVLPRHEWKLARVTATRKGADGQIREAELITSTKKKIRRPVNLLIPLEVQERKLRQITSATPRNSQQQDSESTLPSEEQRKTHSYNLRPRNHMKETANSNYVSTPKLNGRSSSPKWFLFHIMSFTLIQTTLGIRLVSDESRSSKELYYAKWCAIENPLNHPPDLQKPNRCWRIMVSRTLEFLAHNADSPVAADIFGGPVGILEVLGGTRILILCGIFALICFPAYNILYKRREKLIIEKKYRSLIEMTPSLKYARRQVEKEKFPEVKRGLDKQIEQASREIQRIAKYWKEQPNNPSN